MIFLQYLEMPCFPLECPDEEAVPPRPCVDMAVVVPHVRQLLARQLRYLFESKEEVFRGTDGNLHHRVRQKTQIPGPYSRAVDCGGGKYEVLAKMRIWIIDDLPKYSHSIVPRLVSTPFTLTFWLDEGPSLLDECEMTLCTAHSPTNLAPPEYARKASAS